MSRRWSSRAISAAATIALSLLTGRYATPAAVDRAAFRDGGRVVGIVTAIDYRRNELVLKSHNRALHIFVSPSTPVSSSEGNEYHGISDIHVGSRLEIDLSAHGRDYDAQTIEIQLHK